MTEAAVDAEATDMMPVAEWDRLLGHPADAALETRHGRHWSDHHRSDKYQRGGDEREPREGVETRPEDLRHGLVRRTANGREGMRLLSRPAQGDSPAELATARQLSSAALRPEELDLNSGALVKQRSRPINAR